MTTLSDGAEQTPPQPIRNGAAPTIRTANKAIILDGDRMLVNVMRDPDTGVEYYLPPGGGQEWGEDRITALRRECREELGCDVEVEGLACLRTYVGANHAFARYDGWFHQEETFWFCRLADGAEPGAGHVPDERQVGVAWKTLDELARLHGPETGEDAGTPVFSPSPLITWLQADPASRGHYLGDCI